MDTWRKNIPRRELCEDQEEGSKAGEPLVCPWNFHEGR